MLAGIVRCKQRNKIIGRKCSRVYKPKLIAQIRVDNLILLILMLMMQTYCRCAYLQYFLLFI